MIDTDEKALKIIGISISIETENVNKPNDPCKSVFISMFD